MAGSTMETLHHAAVLDICAADARTDAQTQDGELALADAPVGLAQSMSLHVAHHGNGKTKVLAQTRPQLNAGPAGHDLVGIRDGARLGIDDTGGTDTDTEDLDIGIRLESSFDGRLDTLEDGLAALLGLGRNLGLKNGMGHATVSRVLHDGSRDLSSADIDRADVLVLHVALLRR